MKTTGERIKFLRESKGFSQADFAEAIDEKRQTVYKYENDLVSIPLPKVERMAQVLNVHPAYLCCWTDDFEPLPEILKPIPVVGEANAKED